MMLEPCSPSRRQFLRVAGGAAAAIGAGGSRLSCAASAFAPAELAMPPVVVFSKLYQELKLDFEQSAIVTTEAGLDGIDCAVRPGGEVVPERAADDMPRYAEALGKRGVRMLLMTTGILGIDSPHVRDILGTGKKLGIRFYRLGYWSHRPEIPTNKLIAPIKSSLKDLAALNRELEVCALFQNHSSDPKRPDGPVGGDLDELHDIVKDFDPKQIGVAFDLGHAIITHGEGWRSHFEKLKDHIRVVYIKDVRRPATFVRFGEGEFGRADFFELLKQIHYEAPLSIHIEYAWAAQGKKTQAALIETLKHSRRVVADWWQHAAAH
jgi:sugar phosphate isomerase/epimerase